MRMMKIMGMMMMLCDGDCVGNCDDDDGIGRDDDNDDGDGSVCNAVLEYVLCAEEANSRGCLPSHHRHHHHHHHHRHHHYHRHRHHHHYQNRRA